MKKILILSIILLLGQQFLYAQNDSDTIVNHRIVLVDSIEVVDYGFDDDFNDPIEIYTPPKNKIAAGVSIGLGSSAIKYESGPETGKSDFDGSIGLFVNVPIFRLLGIEPEVKYERRYVKEFGGTCYNDALSVPMNLTLSFRGGGFSLILQGGVYYNYIFRGRVGGENMIFGDDAYRRNEWGTTFGIGFCRGRFSMKLVGNNAWTDVFSQRGEIEKRYNATSIAIGYRF